MKPRSLPFFPRNALIRKIAAEPAILLGAGRALLLQVAHPAVAQGVADFSSFQQHPFKRLFGTMEATYAVVFGSQATALGTGQRIQWVHEHVVGPNYRASDVENLLWVHATLFDTMLVCFNTFVRQLSFDDEATLYEEMTLVAELFGCPRDAQPKDIVAFRHYFDQTVNSLEIGDVARQMARAIAFPALPSALSISAAPGLALMRAFAIGFLPAPLRHDLGFHWDEDAQGHFDRAVRVNRRALHALPRSLRIAPGWLWGRFLLASAARHIRDFDRNTKPS